uniref:Arb2 domain-containing protein n=1 Tax=Callorhinchus milii TaxID=7868 RepID=A0A4W3JXY3_CALMI
IHQWYNDLGAILAEYIYELLEEECQLKRVCVPVDASMDEPKSFCYMSEGALTNPSNLIVLLQDRGVIRAGEWSQQLILHDCLNSGSQIPFIKKAQHEHFDVIVLNPNDNFLVIKGKNDSDPREKKDDVCDSDQTECKVQLEKVIQQMPKRGVESAEQHTIYTWDHFISKSAAKNVAFIAHGYGGLAFVNLLNERSQEVMRKVHAVAFINSVHDVWHQNVPKSSQEWIRKTCCNWVLSSMPLDKPVTSMRMNCPQVSAVITSCCPHQQTFKYVIHFTDVVGLCLQISCHVHLQNK